MFDLLSDPAVWLVAIPVLLYIRWPKRILLLLER
jgi:hypothetical protein